MNGQIEGSAFYYIVEVKNGKRRFQSTYRYREALKRMGLSYTEKGKKWTNKFSCDGKGQKSEAQIRKYCKLRGLKYMVKNTEYARDAKYRERFFEKYRPVIGNLYMCMYCGRLIRKNDIEVDHIIPIFKAETDCKVQGLIKKMGWKNANDVNNLGASCRSCNNRKSSKMGFWVLRGLLGKSIPFQIARWAVRIGFMITLLIMSISLFVG